MAVIGIDLGTTNSLVSCWTEQGPQLVKNALGAYLTPSVVGLDDDQSILVGEAALERLLTHPELTVRQRISVTGRVCGISRLGVSRSQLD